MASTRTGPKRTPLSRAAIVDAAVVMADEGGVAALAMRNLADRLGFRVMSLYNHVANKDDLLVLMVDAVAAEIDEPPTSLEPLAAVRALALSTRGALVAHPWAAELWQRHLPGPARIDQMELMLALFAASGLSPELAHHGFHAVTNHVFGYTLQELGMAAQLDTEEGAAIIDRFLADLTADDHPHTLAHINQHLDGHTASSFELVLDLILDGLVRLDR